MYEILIFATYRRVGDFSLGEFQFKIFPSVLTFGQFQFGIFPHLSLSGKIRSAGNFQKFLEFCSDYIITISNIICALVVE